MTVRAFTYLTSILDDKGNTTLLRLSDRASLASSASVRKFWHLPVNYTTGGRYFLAVLPNLLPARVGMLVVVKLYTLRI